MNHLLELLRNAQVGYSKISYNNVLFNLYLTALHRYPISVEGLNYTQSSILAKATSEANLLGGLGASCTTFAFPFLCSGYYRRCNEQNVTLGNGTIVSKFQKFSSLIVNHISLL